jgi:WD40 repeat protein
LNDAHADCIIAFEKLGADVFASVSDDKKINIWNCEDKVKKVGSLEGHDDCIKSIAKMDNNIIATGGMDKVIKLWNWKEGK